MSTRIGLAEAKNKLSEPVDRVAHGEEFIITRHDEAIARLVPARRPSRSELRSTVNQILALRSRGGKPVSLDKIRAWKNTGRP
jgi:prevent-host-death family protein